MSFPAYPEYRSLKAEWGSEIPSHWEAKRLRFACRLNPSKSEIKLSKGAPVSFVPMEAVGEYGGLDLCQEKPWDEIGAGYTYFAEGDVVVAKITPCFENGKGALAAGLTNKAAFGTTELHVVRPSDDLDSRFLFYLTISQPFRKIGESTMFGAGGQKRISDDFIKDFVAGLPPKDEQSQITAFLNHETARIDALLGKKRLLLELLEEKRLAVITQAVTKGLDPNVLMKDSGVEWLGGVPAHWDIAPISSRYDVTLGKMLDAKKISGKHLAPYLRNIDVQWDEINTTNLPQMDFDDEDRERFSLKLGDLVVCEGGEVGRAAEWRGGLHECYYQKAVHRVRMAKEGQFPRFLFYILFTAAKQGIFKAAVNPNTFDHLTAIKLRHFMWGFPASEEQAVIITYIEEVCASIEKASNAIKFAIEKFEEYRSALITNAVTGKIDVRGLAQQEEAA